MRRKPTFRRAARAALRATLAFGACHLLAGILSAQCTGTTTTVTNQTYSSGATQLAGNNSLSLTGVTVNGSATVTAVAGNCVQIQPASEFHSQSGAASFSSWVETTPSAVSVAPSSGTSSSLTQSFTFTASSPLGAGNLSGMFVVVGQQLAPTGTCYFYYNLPSNSIYLADASGNWQPAILAGSSSTIANPQCTINGTGSGYTPSGNQITATVSITFAPTYAGTQNIYLDAFNDEGLSTDYQVMGTWTVPQTYTPITLQSSPPGLVLSLGGQNCVAPCNYSVPAGQPILVSALPQHAPTGTYYVFSGWSDSGAATHTISSPSGTYIATMVVQDFTLSMSAVTGTVILGGQASYTISVINANPAGNFTGTVVLTATNIPAGATATFSPCASGSSANACIWTGSGSIGLTVTTTGPNPDGSIPAGGTTPATNSTVVVNATSGVLSHNAGALMSVQDYFLTVSPGISTAPAGGTANFQIAATGINGYAGQINLYLSHGAYWPMTNVTGLGPLTAGGAPATLSISISNQASPNYAQFAISGAVNNVDAHVINNRFVQVTSGQDFTITPTGSSQSVSPGSTATFPLTISPVNGFTGYVTLTQQYLPSIFAPQYSNGDPIYLSGSLNTSISIPVPSGTQPGTYQFNIQAAATGQGTPYTIPLVLIVTGGGATFTMTATPNQQTIVPGGSATFTVTPTGTGGFNGTVLVTPNGGPPGTTITPANISLPAGQPGTFTVQTTSTAAVGNYPITFIGGYQGATQGTAAALTVAPVSAASMISPIPGNALGFVNGNQIAFAWDNGNGVTGFSLSIDNGVTGISYVTTGAYPCPPLATAPNCAVVTFSSVSTFNVTLKSTTSAGQISQKYTYTVGSSQSPNTLGYFPIVVKNGLPSPPIDLSSVAPSGITGCTAQSGVSPQLVPLVATSVTVTASPTLPTGVSTTPVVCSTNSDGPVSFNPKWEIADPVIWDLELQPSGTGTLKASVTGFSPATGVVTVNGWAIENVDGPSIFVVSNSIPALAGCSDYTAVLAITDSTWEGSQAPPLTVNYCVDGATPEVTNLGARNGTPGDTLYIKVDSDLAASFQWSLGTSSPPAGGENTSSFQLTQPNCGVVTTCTAAVQLVGTGFANLNVTVTTPGGSSASGTIRLRSIKATITAIWSEQFPSWTTNYLPNASDSSPCWNGNTQDTYDSDNNINAGGQGLNPKQPCSGVGAGLIGNARQLLFVGAGQYPSSLQTQGQYYVGASVTTDPQYQEALNNVLVRLQPSPPPAAPDNYPCCTNWIQPGHSGNQSAPDGSGSLNGNTYLVTLNALPYGFGGDFSVVAGVDRQGAGQANGTLTWNQPDLYTFALPCHAAPHVDTNAPAGGPCNNGSVRLVSSDQELFAQSLAFAGITKCALHVLCPGGLPTASSFLAAFVTGSAPADSGANPTASADCLSTSQLYYNTGLLLNNSCAGAGPTSGPVTLYTFTNGTAGNQFTDGSAIAQKILQDPAFIELLNQSLQANKGSLAPGTQTVPAAGCWATAVTVCNSMLAFYGTAGPPYGTPDFYAPNTSFNGDASFEVDIPPLFPCGPNPLIQSAENAGYQIECDLKWAGTDLFNTLGRSGYRLNIRATIGGNPLTATNVAVSGYIYDTYQWNPYAGIYDPVFARLQAGFGSLWQVGQVFNIKVLLGDGTGGGNGFAPVPGYSYTFR